MILIRSRWNVLRLTYPEERAQRNLQRFHSLVHTQYVLCHSNDGNTNCPKATDPGILINIYPNPATYTIPGPAPFACGAGGDSSSPPVEAPEVSSPPVSALPHSTLVTSAKPKASTTKSPGKATGTGAHAPVHT